MTKSKLIDALNRMDELAGICAGDIDLSYHEKSEVKQLKKDYNLLFDFITKARTTPKRIKIPFTYSDAEELYSAGNGEVFNWTFDGVNTIIIKED